MSYLDKLKALKSTQAGPMGLEQVSDREAWGETPKAGVIPDSAGDGIACAQVTEPLTDESINPAAQPEAEVEPLPRAWVIEEVRSMATNEIRAVHLCSAWLECHLWVLADHTFNPPDDDPVFFDDELEALKDKSIDELRMILKDLNAKNTFPRCRVVQ